MVNHYGLLIWDYLPFQRWKEKKPAVFCYVVVSEQTDQQKYQS